jgi:hypothetical protein
MNRSAPEGVGNAGCPLHPRSRVHLVVVERTRATTSTPESPGIPARNGFNGFLRALPGDRAFLSPSSADNSANLTPASRRQDHTTSPSASSALVFSAAASTASRPTSVTIAKRPLCVGRDNKSYSSDLGFGKTEIFLQMGLDRFSPTSPADLPVGQNQSQGLTMSVHRHRPEVTGTRSR